MTEVPIQALRTQLSEILGRVADLREEITVTVAGEPAAVLVHPYQLASMEETLAILADDRLRVALEEAEKDEETCSSAEVLDGLIEITADRAISQRSIPSGFPPEVSARPESAEGFRVGWHRMQRAFRLAAELREDVRQHRESDPTQAITGPTARDVIMSLPLSSVQSVADSEMPYVVGSSPTRGVSGVGNMSDTYAGLPEPDASILFGGTADRRLTPAEDALVQRMYCRLTGADHSWQESAEELQTVSLRLAGAALRFCNATLRRPQGDQVNWDDVPSHLQEVAERTVYEDFVSDTLPPAFPSLSPDAPENSGEIRLASGRRGHEPSWGRPATHEDAGTWPRGRVRDLAGALHQTFTGGDRRTDE